MKTIIYVHLIGSEPYFRDRFSRASKKALPYLWKAETLSQFPRALVEPLGIIIIIAIYLFTYSLIRNMKIFFKTI